MISGFQIEIPLIWVKSLSRFISKSPMLVKKGAVNRIRGVPPDFKLVETLALTLVAEATVVKLVSMKQELNSKRDEDYLTLRKFRRTEPRPL